MKRCRTICCSNTLPARKKSHHFRKAFCGPGTGQYTLWPVPHLLAEQFLKCKLLISIRFHEHHGSKRHITEQEIRGSSAQSNSFTRTQKTRTQRCWRESKEHSIFLSDQAAFSLCRSSGTSQQQANLITFLPSWVLFILLLYSRSAHLVLLSWETQMTSYNRIGLGEETQKQSSKHHFEA